MVPAQHHVSVRLGDAKDLVSAWQALACTALEDAGDPTPVQSALRALSKTTGLTISLGRLAEWRQGTQRPGLDVTQEMLRVVLPAALEREKVSLSADAQERLLRLLAPPASARAARSRKKSRKKARR